MKNLLLTLFLVVITTTTTISNERDTLWYRWTGTGIIDLDFTPDDNFILAWNDELMLWDVKEGILVFSIEKESVGDFNFNNEYIVFSQDSTPKLLKWQSREIIEGFETEDKPLGRIKTAKSRNEFMAQTIDSFKHTFFKDNNTLYLWNIDTKEKIDSIVSLSIFDKDSFRWGRKTIDYDYLGESDELIIIKYADNNSYEIPIESKYHKTNYFYHIYNLQTKEMIDSIFIFQSMIENNGLYVDKIQVMNDRTKIAWNNEGGVINFYDVKTRNFYDNLVFDAGDYEAGDIEFNNKNSLIGIAQGGSCCRYIKIFDLYSKELLTQYNVGSWGQLSFSNNDSLLITSIANILSLYSIHDKITSVPSDNQSNEIMVTQLPNSDLITLEILFSSYSNYKLDLYDLSGKKIYTIDEGQINNLHYSTSFDSSFLLNGSYLIKLVYNSKVVTQLLIKE